MIDQSSPKGNPDSFPFDQLSEIDAHRHRGCQLVLVRPGKGKPYYLWRSSEINDQWVRFAKWPVTKLTFDQTVLTATGKPFAGDDGHPRGASIRHARYIAALSERVTVIAEDQ